MSRLKWRVLIIPWISTFWRLSGHSTMFHWIVGCAIGVSFLDGVSQWYHNLTVVGAAACGCFLKSSPRLKAGDSCL